MALPVNVHVQVTEPAWRVKTRPCEFHLRGKCIFGADKCNFLHITPGQDENYEVAASLTNTRAIATEDESRSVRKEVDYSALKRSVLGELQQRNNGSRESSFRSSKSFNKVRSPPRSPRRASLLLALQDVIGEVDVDEMIESDDDGDDEQPVEPTVNRESTATTTTTIRPPPIDIDSSPSHSPENSSYLLPDDLSLEDDTRNLLDLRRFSHASQVSTLSALSSSLGLSQFPIPPSYTTFSKDDDDNEEGEGEPTKFNDSGFYDSTQPWKTPLPLPLSPPPRTGTGTVFGLLHSPFGSPSRRVNNNSGLMSPGLVSPMGGSFVPRSPQNRGLTTGEMAGYGAECEVQVDDGGERSPSTGSLDSPTEYHHRKQEEQRSRQEMEVELEVEAEAEVESAAHSSLEMSMQDMGILREPSRTFSRPPPGVDLRIQPYGHEVDGRFDDNDDDDTASTPRSVFEDDDDDDYIVEDEDEDEEDEEELEEEDEHDDEPGSSGHTSLWDDAQRNDETVVYLGQRKSTETKTKPPLEFVEEELQGCSSFADGHSQQGQPDVDEEEDYEDEDDDYEETARLAYLGDPENDTIDSLYEVYSDIGSEEDQDQRDRDLEPEEEDPDPNRPYTPAGIPLPSPTHSEVHAYALLSLFDRHLKEERRVTPGDAWAYEPDDSFRSSSGASLRRLFGGGVDTTLRDSLSSGSGSFKRDSSPVPIPFLRERVGADRTTTRDSLSSGSGSGSFKRDSSPVPIPFLRERVFTPPPPPTPPPGEVPPLPLAEQEQEQVTPQRLSSSSFSSLEEVLEATPQSRRQSQRVSPPPSLPSPFSVETTPLPPSRVSSTSSPFSPPEETETSPVHEQQLPKQGRDVSFPPSSPPRSSMLPMYEQATLQPSRQSRRVSSSFSPQAEEPPLSVEATPQPPRQGRRVSSTSSPSPFSPPPEETSPVTLQPPRQSRDVYIPPSSPPRSEVAPLLEQATPQPSRQSHRVSSPPSPFLPFSPPEEVSSVHEQVTPQPPRESRQVSSPPSPPSPTVEVSRRRSDENPLSHRTPPQSSSTRPTTPRSAPASTAVYEKDKRRTSTMVEPDTPMPSSKIRVAKQEQERQSEPELEVQHEVEVSEEVEVEQSENKVLKRGLKPLRLSTLLLSGINAVDSPILTGNGSVFGYSDGAGSHPPSAHVDTRLDSASASASSMSMLPYNNASRSALDDNSNDTTRLSSYYGLLSRQPSPSPSSSFVTPPPATAPAPSSNAILESQSLSIFNPASISLPSSPPASLPSFSRPPSPGPSRSRPPSLHPSSQPTSRSASASRPGSISAGPMQRRQSRIRYIRHEDEREVPHSAPPGSINAWDVPPPHNATTTANTMRMSRIGSFLGYTPSPPPEAETNPIPRNRLSRFRNAPSPTPIRIPTPTPSQASSMSMSVSQKSGESPVVRSRSSRTSPLGESQSQSQMEKRTGPLQDHIPPPPPPPPPPSASTSEKPALLFAIASDDPEEVKKVLEQSQPVAAVAPSSSNANAVTANDTVGPQSQSALEFVLTNDGLRNKLDMVKVLLGYGADPIKAGFDLGDSQIMKKIEDLDEATRYYLSRACSAVTKKTAALMQRSAFRPLQRMRYGIVGQDRALEQLFRVLSMHSGNISKSPQPIVVFLCGPSGHGKSLLAHQFGSLLDVPIHTVNMTTLRSADDLWKSYSISSGEDTVPCTLVEFLANNEGKRCVVVLDEIEKTEDAKALWSLLVPWEFGRCTFEANSRTIDVRNVIWVGTSNIGQDIIFSYHESRHRPDEPMSREEYVELMGIVRPRVSDQLGASVLSRVTATLPFVPFTEQERRAIAAEFVMQSERDSDLVKELVLSQDRETEKRWREKIIQGAMNDFILSEGARSLHRAVSSHLVDSLDDL
ncbi:hypothetical protein PQX77_006289 [Marasmius sp. AFHP31]|nr:hypothetical protein PQX77_006289 [Marasmius sp. AFHP31]